MPTPKSDTQDLRVLNRDAIKYIAVAAMLANHIAHVFLVPGTLWYEILVDIGYFTAITMCYFLVEGFRYTHSRQQYALRLLGFGILSQLPFSLAFTEDGSLWSTGFNMLITLFLCFCILLCIENIKNRFLCAFLIILLAICSLFCDWPLFAPVFTLLFYWSGSDPLRLRVSFLISAAVFGLRSYADGLAFFSAPYSVLHACGSIIGILLSGFVLLHVYNGQRAAHGRKFSQWFFYVFYPAHLLLLWLIRVMM